MEIIDKKGTINKVTFKTIIKESKSRTVTLKSGETELVTCSVDSMIPDIFNAQVINSPQVILQLVSDDKAYEFTGKDYNWFLKGDRLIKLAEYAYDLVYDEETQETVQTVKFDEKFHVATCALDDNEETVICEYSGLKSDCITWLNQQIVKNATIDNEVNMLICLDYDAADPDWKSLKELFDEGKIDLC